MTRRIALAILFSAWAVVLVALVVIYFLSRQTLIAELDDSIITKASALPQLMGVSHEGGAVLPPGDRYMIRNELGQVIVRPEASPHAGSPPVVVSRRFVSVAEGGRLRSITMAFGLRGSGNQAQQLATIVYSAPADVLDALLKRMAILLCAVGAAGGIITSAVAVKVSRAALRPLRQTAEVIGTIDERRLDRRVKTEELPKELRPMAQRLNEMLARLEREFVQRKQFLADTAHELRTPVAAILTHLEVTLRRPRDAAALAEALENSLSDVRMLRRLVDALLEQVRSDRPAEAAQLVATDISSLLDQCATLADALAAPKNVQIVREIPSGLRGQTLPVALQSIVTNLLANAVEYSPSGTRVEMVCRLAGGQIEITVRDSGPGIAPEALPHIFQPFYRVNKSRGAADGHLGLGLFLVQSHARSLGGRCEVQSTMGVGTAFRIEFPLSNLTSQTSPAAEIEDLAERSEISEGSHVVV